MTKKHRIKGQRIGQRGKKIIIKDLDTGELREVDPLLCMIKIIDPVKQIAIYKVT